MARCPVAPRVRLMAAFRRKNRLNTHRSVCEAASVRSRLPSRASREIGKSVVATRAATPSTLWCASNEPSHATRRARAASAHRPALLTNPLLSQPHAPAEKGSHSTPRFRKKGGILAAENSWACGSRSGLAAAEGTAPCRRAVIAGSPCLMRGLKVLRTRHHGDRNQDLGDRVWPTSCDREHVVGTRSKRGPRSRNVDRNRSISSSGRLEDHWETGDDSGWPA